MARPTKYKPEMCQVVIDMMKDGAALIEVCAKIDITMETLTQWRKDPKKPEFSEAVKRGVELSEAWWIKMGRKHLTGTSGGGEVHVNFNHVLWYMNMKNRFGWVDKQVNYNHNKEEKTVYKIKDDDDKTHEIGF